MVYSSKKPYQTESKSSSRFLKEGVGPESVFEKPYQQGEYGDMNQSPNVPTIPPNVGGTGGLVCLYSRNECEINAECYAGPDIEIAGGPEEAGAGYTEPVVVNGALIDWSIGADSRQISLVLDPSMSRNIITVEFIDGWGNPYTQTIDAVCYARSDPPGWFFVDSFQVGSYTDAGRMGYHSVDDTVYLPIEKTLKTYRLDVDLVQGGGTWTGDISQFVYDEHNDLMVAVDGGIRVSNGDAGTWTLRKTFSGGEIGALGYDPVNFTLVIAFRLDAGDRDIEIWISTDGGTNWSHETTIGSNPFAPIVFCFDAGNENLILACYSKIYSSSDGGYNWSFLVSMYATYSGSPIDDMCYNSGNDTLVLVLGYDATPETNYNVFISSDGGSTWAGQTVHLNFGTQESSKVAYNSNKNKLYVGISVNGTVVIYVSTNGGTTWTLDKTFSGGSSGRRISSMIYVDEYLTTFAAYSDDLFLHSSQLWKSTG